jgi:endonuclease/exonuclease/phosphatase family metal-dependent hydrolase
MNSLINPKEIPSFGFSIAPLMNFICLITTASIIVSGCKKEPHDYENHRTSYYTNIRNDEYLDTIFTCLTYNIQLGFKAHHDPWNADQVGGTNENLTSLVEVIKKIDPSIIALQEVPRNRHNTEIKVYIEELARRLNMNYAFGSHGFNDPTGIYPVHGEWGNGILSKYQILNIENIEISYLDKWRKRSLLSAELKVNGNKNIHVITIHYGLTLDEYNSGLENTKAYIDFLQGPVILAGDFNPQFGVRELRDEMEKIEMADADSGFLHGGDRIYYSGTHFTFESLGHYYDTVNWTTDHPANYCTLVLDVACDKAR